MSENRSASRERGRRPQPFALIDRRAVAEAVADGATRPADAPPSVTFGGQMGLSAVEG